ncbi:MAG: hypothetical protein ACTSW7_04570 [Candidatus Thorarchaeota archaeon]
MEELLKEIKEEYDREGTRFELIKKGDRFIRFRYYSDSSGETYEKEKGYTDDDERYSGGFGAYERYKKRSTIEVYDWDSDTLKALLEKYCAHRTPTNFYIVWFYWYITGAVLNEIQDYIEISNEDHLFFRIDPEIALPNTSSAMKSRCLEILPQIIEANENRDEYFHGYLQYDMVFEHACSCDDGRMTRCDEVIEELMSIPSGTLKKMLSICIKITIEARLDEI